MGGGRIPGMNMNATTNTRKAWWLKLCLGFALSFPIPFLISPDYLWVAGGVGVAILLYCLWSVGKEESGQ